MTDAPPRLGGLALGAGLTGAGLVNICVINGFPFLAGGLISGRGASPIEAGLLISVELLVSALVALGFAAWARRVSPRALAVAGSLLFAAGGVLAAVLEGSDLAAARCLAGAGEGLALAAYGRGLASAAFPARLSSAVATVLAVIGVLVAVGCGAAVAGAGYGGGSLFLAALGLIGAGLGLRLPAHGTASPAGAPRPRSDRRAAIPLLVGVGLIYLGAGAVWNFSERIGLHAGLAAPAVAAAIGFTSLAGVLGGAAGVAVARLGRDRTAATAGTALFGGALVALALAASPAAFVAALTLLSFGLIFVTPFFLALAVKADSAGGLAAAVQGTQMLTAAGAPFLGGVLLEHGSFTALALLAGAATLLAVLAIGAVRPSRA